MEKTNPVMKNLFIVKKIDRNIRGRDSILPRARDEINNFKAILEDLRKHKRNFHVPDPEAVHGFLTSFSRFGVIGGGGGKLFMLEGKSHPKAKGVLERTYSYLSKVSHNPDEFNSLVVDLREFSPALSNALISLYVSETHTKRLLKEAGDSVDGIISELDLLFEELKEIDRVLAHAIISVPLEHSFKKERNFFSLDVSLESGWKENPHVCLNLAYSSNNEKVVSVVEGFFDSAEEQQERLPIEVHRGITVLEKVLYPPKKRDSAVAY